MYPICATSVLESQISVLFTQWPKFVEIYVHDILRQMHWMNDPNSTWTLQRQRCLIYVLLAFSGAKFYPMMLHEQPISSYRPF